jgi:hypothetical protein
MRSAPGYGFGLVAVAAFGLGACGDGGDGGGSSGVPDSTKVTELTESEKTALCEEFADRFKPVSEDLKIPSCSIDGIIAEMSGDGATTCEEARDACLAQEDDGEAQDCSMNEEIPENCDITVGEYRDCIDAYAGQVKNLASQITCDSDLQDLQNFEPPETPAACMTVQTKCPELAPDDIDMGDVETEG